MISVRSSGLGRDKDALTQDVELRPAIHGLLRPVPEVHEPDVGVRCLVDCDIALGVADDDGVA